MSDEEMEQGPDAVVERLRALTDELESLARDRGLISALSPDERTRLLNAAGDLLQPGRGAQAAVGQGGAAPGEGSEARARRGGARRDRHPRAAREAGLHDAERRSRRPASSRSTSTTSPSSARSSSRSTATSASSTTSRSTPSTTSCARRAATSTIAKRTRDRRPARPRRAAHRRAREDRLPGRDQAAARGRAADRDDALPARLRRRATRRSPTSTTGATGSRSSASTCATRRASRRSATHLRDDARPARLHRQQRLPDRAPAARVLPPHARGRDGVGAARCPRTCGGCSARTRACGATTCCRPAAALPGAPRSPASRTPPSCRRCRCCPRTSPAQGDLFPEGRLDQDLQQVDLREPQLVAAAARRGLVGRAARDAARQRGRAVRPQRAPEAADAAHARARQAHRQRVGGRGAVLPPLQDDAASAHEHGEGGAEHDDAHLRGRLPRRRHPHEQRRHRLGDRRGPGRTSPSARRPSTASTRRSTSSTAPRASSIRSSTASTPATHVWGQFLKDYRPTDW